MTFDKVSVLVPTRGRIARLTTLLASYKSTTIGAEHLSELIFRVDDDDEPTLKFLANEKTVIGPRLQGYRSLPTFFNSLGAYSSGDVIMLGNDDMVFDTKNWNARILDAANRFPDGLFDLGVETFNEDHFPFATISRKAIDAIGCVWPTNLFWGDIFWRDVMGHFQRSIRLFDVKIEHRWAGHEPDQTFNDGKQHEIYQNNPNYWTDVHVPTVAEAVAKLRKLKEAA